MRLTPTPIKKRQLGSSNAPQLFYEVWSAGLSAERPFIETGYFNTQFQYTGEKYVATREFDRSLGEHRASSLNFPVPC